MSEKVGSSKLLMTLYNTATAMQQLRVTEMKIKDHILITSLEQYISMHPSPITSLEQYIHASISEYYMLQFVTMNCISEKVGVANC
jgi:hypothetical protein